MKIGLMGGSFDPVHFGHLIAAQDALEQFHLDKLYFIPAAQAPLKPNEVQASAAARLAMLHAALGDDPRLEVSDFELRQGGISYTIDTVRHFRSLFPQAELLWVIGADQVARLPQWKEIGVLVGLVEFVYLARPGYSAEPTGALPGLRLRRGQGHLIEISSSEVRDRVKRGASVRFLCPQKVIAYLKENRLYC